MTDDEEDKIREICTPVHLKLDWVSWCINGLCWACLIFMIWVALK